MKVAGGPSLLGALFGIALDGSPWQYMLTLKDRQGYDGVTRIPLPGGDFHFLLSASSVKEVTVDSAEEFFPRRYSLPLFEALQLDKGIVYEQGARHRRQKRLCIPAFERSGSMESFLLAVQEETEALAADWRRRYHADGALDLDAYREMRRLTLAVVLRVSFGLGGEARNFKESEELSETIGGYLEAIVATANEIPPLWSILPALSPNYRAVTGELLPRLRGLVGKVIRERRDKDGGSLAAGELAASDLLSQLVREDTLSDEDIQFILFDLVIAGSDTTASTITAALFLLHEPEHLAALEAARAEAGAVDLMALSLEEVRSKLPFATAVARETLRLYPPVPFVGRTSTAEAEVGGVSVPKGATMCWSPWFLGREEGSWGSAAARFDPERWMEDPSTGGAPSNFCWLPFGAGPRGCLGTRLGLTEVVLGVAILLKSFDLRFERVGQGLKYKYDLTLNLEGTARCTVTPRR